MLKIGVIIGSTRDDRVSPQVAEWVMSFTEGRDDAAFELIDIKDYDFPEFNNQPPGMLNREYGNDEVTRWSQKIDELDGFIFVTPEYNKIITPSLSNAIDQIGPEWGNKAASSVSYGSTLGVAATFSLRQTLSNLGVAITPSFGALSLFADFDNMTEFNPGEYHNESIEATIDSVVSWAGAMKTLR